MITSVDFFYLAHYFECLFTRLAALIFDEVTFARFQPALQNQNKFLNFASETNRDRRLVLYTCLSPPIVSGKAFLSCTTYLLKVCATFLVKLLPINCSHAKSKAFAFRLLFFKQQLLTRPDLWRPPLYSKLSDHI